MRIVQQIVRWFAFALNGVLTLFWVAHIWAGALNTGGEASGIYLVGLIASVLACMALLWIPSEPVKQRDALP